MKVLRPPIPPRRRPPRAIVKGRAPAADACDSAERVIDHSESVCVDTFSLIPESLRRNSGLNYELGTLLGEGGMGAVYRAEDKALHRAVAVKVMHEEVAGQELMTRRFYKEAQISAQLEHPGIVPTYTIQIGETGKPRLAMRLIDGATLLEHISEERERYGSGPESLKSLGDRLELFVRACDAVHFAHERGVVHRDLKPENIMVGPHRDAYVMDWGIATLRDEGSGQSLRPEAGTGDDGVGEMVEVDDDPRATTVGVLMGTIAYMAPEQAMGLNDDVGPQSDQFAMAMTLQELIVLDDARCLDSVPAALTHAVLGERQELPKWVPEGLGKIIEKAGAADSHDRYANMSDFAEDVRRFMRDEELAVAPDPWAKKLWRRLSRHKALVLGGVLLLVLLLAVQAVSLVLQDLDRARAEAAHAREVASQLGQVTAAAQSVNARARGVEMELAALASLVKHVLSSASAPPTMPLRPVDLEGPKAPRDAKKVERYNQVVSFERAVMTRAPSADPRRAEADERRLALIEAEFKRAHEAGGLVRGVRNQKQAAPLQWTFVGTENGVLLNYPGAAGLDQDYDPRSRPWYQAAKGTHGPKWGALYGDASGSGTLMASNRAVYGNSGELLAVVGIDFRLRDIEMALARPNMKDFVAAWLLNESGEIVASSKRAERNDVQDDNRRVLEKFGYPELIAAILEQPAAGQRVIGAHRYLYAAVPAVGWTYVVAVAPD